MTKIQKVWLGIFLAMFIVPEVLWSPVFKTFYMVFEPLKNGSYQIWRPNFLDNSMNFGLWRHLVFFQFCILILTCIYLIIIRKSFVHKAYLWISIVIVLMAALFVLYLFAVSNVSINIL